MTIGKTFEQRRLERIEQLRAGTTAPPSKPLPVSTLRPSSPVPRLAREQYDLLRVGRTVLRYALEALEDESAPPSRRRSAAELLRRELGGGR